MKRLCSVCCLVLAIWLSSVFSANAAEDERFKEGDILFQSLNTGQSLAIRLATKSEYTHCGIVFKKDGALFVYEAVHPVTWTPLKRWIGRSPTGHHVLMRLKNRDAVLTPKVLAAMKKSGAAMNGKPYDLLFQWSDDRIYCSELVWKIYQRGAGIELTPLRTFRDFDLNHAEVQRIARERYGAELPLDENVVAPSDLMASDLLEVIGEKGKQP